MKNITFACAIASCISLASPRIIAGDQPINCRLVDQEVKLYGEHQASCTTSNAYPIPNVQLSQYVSEQAGSSIVLRSYNYPFPASCRAQLSYYRSVYQQAQRCDYTPAAKFFSTQQSYPVSSTLYTSDSTDRDGQIVKTEWLSGTQVLSTSRNFGFIQQTKPTSLQLKVTDNQGYSDTVTIF